MSDGEEVKMNTDEEKVAKQVINTDRSVRDNETLEEAFIKRIKETLNIGDTGFARTIVFPIPIELINRDERTKEFISKVGNLARSGNPNIKIGIEDSDMGGVRTMDFIVDVKQELTLEEVKDYI